MIDRPILATVLARGADQPAGYAMAEDRPGHIAPQGRARAAGGSGGHESANTQCTMCDRPISGARFRGECWRCSIAAIFPRIYISLIAVLAVAAVMAL
ncbi:hypothetical protein [Sphingomonas sp.]|uniref:hypothetical protein n=1 Tax=Sphingomonas sp. TaxID=28214 RepID=UPI00389DFC76